MLGLALVCPPPFLRGGSGAKWWQGAEHRLDGLSPAFFADVLGARHMLAGAAATLADILGVTNASTERTYLDASGVLRTASADTPRVDWSSGVPELLLEGQRINKVTARKHNPVDLTNLTKTGDAAATLAVVDDAAALAAAGLGVVCANGKVYRLDNAAGTTPAQAQIGGTTGNVNVHSCGAWIRGGSGSLNAATAFPAATAYRLVRREGFTPASSTQQLVIAADAGQTVWFVLPQLSESAVLASTIAGDTTAAVTIPADLARLTTSAAAALQGGFGAVAWRGQVPTLSSGQVFLSGATTPILRTATTSPYTGMVMHGGTGTSIANSGENVVPGNVGIAMAWSADAALGSVDQNTPTSRASGVTVSLSTIQIGPPSGLSAEQVLRIRQLVGWTPTVIASTTAVQAQARVAA